jgi:ABC-2 type transport system permease protein
MNWKKIFAIVRREYVERVRTKAFWIATLIIPFLFLAYIAFQISASRRAGGERQMVVVDLTGGLYQPLTQELAAAEAAQKKKATGSKGAHWVLTPRPLQGDLEAAKEALRQDVLAKKIDAYLILDPAKLQKDEVEYYSTTVSDFVSLKQLETSLNRIRMRERIQKHGLPPEMANELEKSVDLKLFKVTEKGTAEEKGAGLIAAVIFMVLMYTTFFVYGAQVMRGVIEEKSSRIVEIIIASVRPTELMLGKILGIGLVGLTQYAVWSLVAMNLSLPVVA